MKKAILFLSILIFLSYTSVMGQSVSSSKTSRRTSAENVKESVIENGLAVFALEDFSNPLVRIEVNVRAGVSLQNSQNAGFFKLLSILIQKSAKNKFDAVECNADSTRFILTASPSSVEEIFSTLSDDIFNPIFSDEVLKQELSSMKREVLQNSGNLSYLINSSIDARVFADEPWKHDTGIYPSLFANITEANARALLNEIQENFYIPQNIAIFVSGNIRFDAIIKLIENSFGRYYSNKKLSFLPLKTTSASTPAENQISEKGNVGGGKRFVIHDKQFSEELTQIVVQYVSFEHEQAEVAASILNDDNSKFKQDVSNMVELRIPGAEYINVASAYKSGCTRLIFQSIMQNQLSSNSKTTSFTQVMKFLEATQKNTKISRNDFEKSISKNNSSYKKVISTSSSFMDMLSQFWAIKPYVTSLDYNMPENYQSVVSYQMQRWNENLKDVSLSSINNVFDFESPFVFVILNTTQYKKNKSDFDAQGFEEVTEKNSSWYTQSLNKNIQASKNSKIADSKATKSVADSADSFYENNKASISSRTLSNGINLCVKENPNTTGVTFVIAIDGGHLRTADDHGFEEVMINILTTNMLRQIEQKQSQMQIIGDYEIFSETKLDYSRIVLECDADEFIPVLGACVNALILDDIRPADADMVVQGRRTRKRLENGSTVNQLYYAAINELFPKSDYTKIFETENEILETANYEKILQSYPQFLDSNRFSIVVSGNVNVDEVANQVTELFSVLQNHTEIESIATSLPVRETKSPRDKNIKLANFPAGKQNKVKLNHTFLTDVSANDAGPMPQKLIPTKNFSDPVLYCIKSPEIFSDDYFIFNSILPYLQTLMNESTVGYSGLLDCKISVAKPSVLIPMTTVTFSSVERTSAVDTLYLRVLENLKNDLSQTSTIGKTLQKIKDTYIASEFQDALTNTGSAILIDDGIHEAGDNVNILDRKIYSLQKWDEEMTFNATAYLEMYQRVNNISAERILYVLEKYFSFAGLYRLYSADSKR